MQEPAPVTTTVSDDINCTEEPACDICPECGGTACFWDDLSSEIIEDKIRKTGCNVPVVPVSQAPDFVAPSRVGRVGQEDISATSRPVEGLPTAENHAKMRKTTYASYVRCRYGFIGQGNRVKLPSCVVREIRRIWRDADEDYIGFRSS